MFSVLRLAQTERRNGGQAASDDDVDDDDVNNGNSRNDGRNYIRMNAVGNVDHDHDHDFAQDDERILLLDGDQVASDGRSLNLEDLIALERQTQRQEQIWLSIQRQQHLPRPHSTQQLYDSQDSMEVRQANRTFASCVPVLPQSVSVPVPVPTSSHVVITRLPQAAAATNNINSINNNARAPNRSTNATSSRQTYQPPAMLTMLTEPRASVDHASAVPPVLQPKSKPRRHWPKLKLMKRRQAGSSSQTRTGTSPSTGTGTAPPANHQQQLLSRSTLALTSSVPPTTPFPVPTSHDDIDVSIDMGAANSTSVVARHNNTGNSTNVRNQSHVGANSDAQQQQQQLRESTSSLAVFSGIHPPWEGSDDETDDETDQAVRVPAQITHPSTSFLPAQPFPNTNTNTDQDDMQSQTGRTIATGDSAELWLAVELHPKLQKALLDWWWYQRHYQERVSEYRTQQSQWCQDNFPDGTNTCERESSSQSIPNDTPNHASLPTATANPQHNSQNSLTVPLLTNVQHDPYRQQRQNEHARLSNGIQSQRKLQHRRLNSDSQGRRSLYHRDASDTNEQSQPAIPKRLGTAAPSRPPAPNVADHVHRKKMPAAGTRSRATTSDSSTNQRTTPFGTNSKFHVIEKNSIVVSQSLHQPQQQIHPIPPILFQDETATLELSQQSQFILPQDFATSIPSFPPKSKLSAITLPWELCDGPLRPTSHRTSNDTPANEEQTESPNHLRPTNNDGSALNHPPSTTLAKNETGLVASSGNGASSCQSSSSWPTSGESSYSSSLQQPDEHNVGLQRKSSMRESREIITSSQFTEDDFLSDDQISLLLVGFEHPGGFQADANQNHDIDQDEQVIQEMETAAILSSGLSQQNEFKSNTITKSAHRIGFIAQNSKGDHITPPRQYGHNHNNLNKIHEEDFEAEVAHSPTENIGSRNDCGYRHQQPSKQALENPLAASLSSLQLHDIFPQSNSSDLPNRASSSSSESFPSHYRRRGRKTGLEDQTSERESMSSLASSNDLAFEAALPTPLPLRASTVGSMNTSRSSIGLRTTFQCHCCFDTFPTKSIALACDNLQSVPHLFCKDCIRNFLWNARASRAFRKVQILKSPSSSGTTTRAHGQRKEENPDPVCAISCLHHDPDDPRKPCSGTIHVRLAKLFPPSRVHHLVEAVRLRDQEQQVNMEAAKICATTVPLSRKTDRHPKGKTEHSKNVGESSNSNIGNMDAMAQVQRAMKEALTKMRVRGCPHCHEEFSKNEDGCNQIVCPVCHTSSCFCCRQIVSSQQGRPGGDHFMECDEDAMMDIEKCPLWTTPEIDLARDQLRMKQDLLTMANRVWEDATKK